MPHETVLPKQVIEAGKRAEAASEALKKANGVDSDGGITHQNPIIEGEQQPAGAQPIPIAGSDLDWEKEYKLLAGTNDTLQSRFDVLQGKYNAEVPRLTTQVNELTTENDNLKAVGGGNATHDNPNIEGAAGDDVPAEIVDLYGEDLINWVKSQRGGGGKKVQELSDRLDRLDDSRKRDAVDTFFGAIEKVHPDWKVVNRTQAWLNFMAEVLPDYGMDRQQIVDNAQDSGNPGPIIAQLTAFKERSGDNSGKTNKVVPSDAGGGSLPEDNSTTRYNESTVKSFYKAASQGKYNGNTEEFNRLDRLYSDAAVQDRINPGR